MHKVINYTLEFLKPQYFESIIRICNEQLGTGFLNEEILQNYYNNDSKFCHVVLVEEKVAAFSLMEVGSCLEISKRLKSGNDWFRIYFKKFNKLAYRSLTAVDPPFEGKGIASFLVSQGLDFLSGKAELVFCDAWKSESTHIGHILERHGLKPIKDIPMYWANESLKYHFSCSFCGTPPCTCTAIIYVKYFNKKSGQWWVRSDLKYQDGHLHLADVNLSNFVKNKPTPFYVYDIEHIISKYQKLERVLSRQEVDFQIYYAMKANRHPAILSHLKSRTSAGIDVCSPNELDLALQLGYREEQISFTGTSLSDNDLEILSSHTDIKINLDSLSAVRRFNKLKNKREIGIRINPDIGMAYNVSLEYSGNKIVKFGIYEEQWIQLKQIIDDSELKVTTVHCHCGSGFLNRQLERLPAILEKIKTFIQIFPDVHTLNLGGGLGVQQKQGDKPLNLIEWASVICQFARENKLKLALEPGDFLVKESGILIARVNSVEEKKGKIFVGVDAGMNINNEYAYYKMNLEAAPILEPETEESIQATICGNINEPIDLFSEDKKMPPVSEGDYIALLNSGGYGASSSSNHCMRGNFKEYVICNPTQK